MKTIALIGYGKFGKKLFEKFCEYGEIKFVCKRKINNELLELKKQFKIELSNNYNKVVEKVDLVVIATLTDSHYIIAKNCLLKEKNIFVEKPLCTTLEEAQELFDIAKRKNLKIYMDDVFLHRREYQKLKKLISNEKINKLRFTWKKYGTFEDSILNALVYHDMYLLIDLLEEANLENLKILQANSPLHENRIDILELKFKFNDMSIECLYDRTSNEKEKSLKVVTDNKIFEWKNEQILVNNQSLNFEIKNDALSIMISNLLNKKVDYEKNNLSALKSLQFIKEIENALTLQNTH